MTRMALNQIPRTVVDFVESVLGGRIVEFVNQVGGFSKGAAARVKTESGTRGFVKAISRSGYEGTFALYRAEVVALRELPKSAPAPGLLASYDDGEWIALVIEDVEGTHPTSVKQVRAVLDVVAGLPQIYAQSSLPSAADAFEGIADLWDSVPADSVLLGEWGRAHFAKLAEDASRGQAAIRGNQLVHADLRPDNVLIDQQGKVWLLDWPYACVGNGWFDALLFLFDCSLKYEDVDLDLEFHNHPLFEGVSPDDVDAVLALHLGYYIDRSSLPAIEVPASLREFQRKNAVGLLAWMERRALAAD